MFETDDERLLVLFDKAQGIKPPERRRAVGIAKDFCERDAELLIQEYGPQLGLRVAAAGMAACCPTHA